MAQKIDVISSVSGGSVAAGYFALAGPEGFDTLEKTFIEQDGMSALILAGLNPIGLARLATPGTERIDLLIDYLNRQLFDGQTYHTLVEQKRRPFLILNAADMVEGVPFPFTQRKMDLLCSSLTAMPLATAVAASAAFPVALSPVTLKNYSPCPATEHKNKEFWPEWVKGPLKGPTPEDTRTLWYKNPQRTALARVEDAYARGNAPDAKYPKKFIHLLDGGIADNLGVLEPFRMLVTDDTAPSFNSKIDGGDIKKLIFVMINARSFSTSTLDQQQATPGMLDMLLASIDAPLDRATSGTAARLRTLLFDELRQLALTDPDKQARYRALAANSAFIAVDFDAIVDDDCRRRFHAIPTSWTLEKQQVQALAVVGKALLGNDPQFAELLRISGATRPELPTLKQACDALR